MSFALQKPNLPLNGKCTRLRRAATGVSVFRATETYQLANIDKECFFIPSGVHGSTKSLLASDRPLLRSIDYKFSPISEEELQKPAKRKRFPPPRLATDGYQFLNFQDTRLVEASPGTRKLIRYHDPLPIVSPDTFSDEGHIKRHLPQSSEPSATATSFVIPKLLRIYWSPVSKSQEKLVRHSLHAARPPSQHVEDVALQSIIENRSTYDVLAITTNSSKEEKD